MAFQLYIILCFISVILSWIPLQGTSFEPVGNLVKSATEPLFGAVRKVMPSFGDIPIDFSPAVVIIGLTILKQIVCQAVA